MDDTVLRDICLAIAGMSATAGSVVAVLVAFASQELKHSRQAQGDAVDAKFFQEQWNRSRTWMLAINGTLSICALMLTSLFGILGVYDGFVSLRCLVEVSIGVFSFGIYCILMALGSYIFQERD